MTGAVRIIGGRFKRTRLPVLDVPGLRPTPDRVRETLFNWLGPDIEGARCLDLFAGSGALGFEAASRGAAHVVLVESEPALVRSLREQVERLDAGAIVEVVQARVEDWLRARASARDIVLMDPPFASTAHGALARALAEHGWLARGALVYVESASAYEDLDLPDSWTMLRSNKAGQVRYHLACTTPAGQAAPPAGVD